MKNVLMLPDGGLATAVTVTFIVTIAGVAALSVDAIVIV